MTQLSDFPQKLYTQDSRPLTKRRGRVLALAGGLLVLVGLGLVAARSLRRERRLCLLLSHEVERSAAPDERVVVDDEVLEWCLQHVGSMEMRRKLQFVRRESQVSSLLADGRGEFLLVTTEDDPLLAKVRASGWEIREAARERPGLGLGRGDVQVFFIVGR